MSTFTLKLKNSTNSVWNFGLYKECPTDVTHSTVWKSKPVPPNGTDQISWGAHDYGVAIVQLNESGEIIGKQIFSAEQGKAYEVVTRNGYPSVNPHSTGQSGASDVISLKNNTDPSKMINEGLALGGDILSWKKGVYGGITSEFQICSSYWIDCYQSEDATSAENAPSSEIVEKTDPQEFKFPTGIYTMNAEISFNGEKIVLKLFQEK